jgi:diguanylate cyclase (GGDEF)-like protein
MADQDSGAAGADISLPTRAGPGDGSVAASPFLPAGAAAPAIATVADPGLPPGGGNVVVQDALFAGLGLTLVAAVLLAFRLRNVTERMRRQALERELTHREAARLKDELAQREDEAKRDVERRTARLVAENRRLQRDRAELDASRLRLVARTDRDELTGLYDSRAFSALVGRELRRALRDGSRISLVAWQVDAFAELNRAAGHDRGDQALQRIAALIRDACRRGGDMAGRGDSGRFMALLPHTPGAGAMRVAERVRERTRGLAVPHPASPVGDRVTVSAGVAELDPATAVRPEDALAAVEAACAEARRRGGDRTVKVRIRAPAPAAAAGAGA